MEGHHCGETPRITSEVAGHVIQLFTVFTALLSVSGASYASINAFRSYLEKKSKDDVQFALECSKQLKDKNSQSITKRTLKRENWLKWALWFWNTAFFLPVVLFCIAAFWLSAHFLWAYWDLNPEGKMATQSVSCWNWYRYFLASLLVLDLLSIVATILAYFAIGLIRNILEDDLTVESEKIGEDLPSDDLTSAMSPAPQ